MIYRETCGCHHLRANGLFFRLTDCTGEHHGDVFLSHSEEKYLNGGEPVSQGEAFKLLDRLKDVVNDGYAAQELKRAFARIKG